MSRILYIGGFVLPDRNAAAQRVVGIAKGLRELGHQVFFLNYSDQVTTPCWTEYFSFACYDAPKRGMYSHLTNIDDVIRIIDEKKITSVIAYNYPAIALSKLIRWCHRHSVKCYADATEWYSAQGNIVFRVIKTIDTEWRMRLLHKRMDGVIAISDYLYQYYRNKVQTVKIPPTVDTADEKWQVQPIERTKDKTVFVYAGSPSAQKERLDLILGAAETVKARHPLVVRVLGITEAQYETMYGKKAPEGCVEFLGRISHMDVIREVKAADWSIIIRDNNKVVKAGFPTKVVESISCGTPVIANTFSNVEEYLDGNNSILCEKSEVVAAMERACGDIVQVDCERFGYIHFLEELVKIGEI